MSHIWSWGANSHGQLSQGVINEQIDKPTKILFKTFDIKKISCGGGHTLLIDANGKIFSCGWNHKGQLALEAECCELQRIWELSGIQFIDIATGWDFSCGVTDDKFLFVWGCNSHGQLGLPKDHFFENVRPIRLHVNACAVAMGLRHSVVINSKSEVWATGCGKYGQLGLGSEKLKTDRFEQVAKVKGITHIACGQNHTIAWSSQERALYVWGDNRHGQLLLNPEKYRKLFDPQKVDIGITQDIKKLLSGWTNALLWLTDNRMFTWGRNNYGQLGTKKPATEKVTPIVLPGKRQPKEIALGSEHTICLATDNTFWAWGWNEHGNTGTGTDDAIFEPKLVRIELGKNLISQIYAGGGHNFIVIDETQDSQNQDAKQ